MMKDQLRCLHYDILSNFDRLHEAYGDDIDTIDGEFESRVNELGDLMPSLRPLFQGLRDRYLSVSGMSSLPTTNRLLYLIRRHRWHLGTCVPKDVLGPGE